MHLHITLDSGWSLKLDGLEKTYYKGAGINNLQTDMKALINNF